MPSSSSRNRIFSSLNFVFVVCLLLWSGRDGGMISVFTSSIHCTGGLLMAEAAKAAKTAAIPRSKSSKKGSSRIPGGGVFQKLFREAKIGFCSELEALTLQLTRPNTAAVSMAAVGEVINFVNLEHDNPQLMISLLVKFSRKLAEHNVYTKLKSVLVLHKLMENVQEKARSGLSQAIASLRSEMDEKASAPFFSTIEDAAAVATNVADIEAVELARMYYEYVFEFIDTKGAIAMLATEGSISKSIVSQKKADIAESLLNLLDLSAEAEVCCKRAATALNKQCLESLKEDRQWIVAELSKLYQTEADQELRSDMEEVLMKFDPKFKAVTGANSVAAALPSIEPKPVASGSSSSSSSNNNSSSSSKKKKGTSSSSSSTGKSKNKK